MTNWQHQVAMTYYKMMRQVRSRIDLGPKQIRTYMDTLSILTPPPIGFDIQDHKAEDVPIQIVKHKSSVYERCILFIHGGAFAFGSARTHRPAACFLAKKLQCTVWLPEYRTAPEFRFPVPLEDCIKAYRAMRQENPEAEIFVAGDSAGGNLSAALTVYCIQQGIEPPDRLVLMSAWLDLRPESNSCSVNYADESIFDTDDLQIYATHYLAGKDADDPLVSPLLAPIEQFPPTFIQVTKNELLYPDSKEFFEKLQQAGIPSILDEEENLFHSWQLLPDYLPAAKKSLGKIARFLDS